METIHDKLADAQRAIELPEVQELARRLAAYGLGVILPHMHDRGGDMLPLPEGMVQVEDDLVVSFKPDDQVIDRPDVRYLPVGWRWSDVHGRVMSTHRCPMVYDTEAKQWKHSGVQQNH